ncbi:MAG: CPBP family intramembrane metalloprotease [Clostridia bacterium]|jgi:membrane protease YdiL (CAAX protease family)|nr:CPBP family intramembrane metalloprotease [Clostridia bacterium]
MIRSYQTPPWSVVEALLVFAIVLSTKLFIPFSLRTWFNSLSQIISPNNLYLGQLFLNSLLLAVFFFLLIGLIIKLKYRLGWSEVGLRTGRGKNWLFTGVIQGILLFLAMTVILTIISMFYSFEVEQQEIVDVFNTAKTRWEQFLCLFIAAVAAPLSEELYFRGFLYPAIGKITGKLPAVIITSIFFSMLHFDLIRFIPIVIAGIWLNMLYIKTGSLYTSIMAHSVWNTIMILLLFFSQSAVGTV